MLVTNTENLTVTFNSFDISEYELFLKAKRLPEFNIALDENGIATGIVAPARYASLLGIEKSDTYTSDLPLPEFLFEHQKAIVQLALTAKRFAVWGDCGVGKTVCELEFGRQVIHKTGGRALLITLNDVVSEIVDEAKKFYADLRLHVIKSRQEMREWCKNGYKGKSTTKEHCGLAEPYLIALEHMSGEHNSRCKSLSEPMQTICGKGSFGLISPYLVEFHGGKDSDKRVRSTQTPLPTADTSNRFGLAQPFLIKYFEGSNAASIEKPLPTITANYEHLGLAQPEFENSNTILLIDSDGQIIGEVIGKLDIKFRMLQPHELAAAMSFPKSYSFAGNRAEQVKQIGNAVPCHLAAALCRSLIENKLTVKKEKAA